MLFTLWMGEMHRPTKDLDLLGWGSSALEEVEKTVREICAVEEDDGLAFDGASVAGERIKEDDEYEGVRVKLSATLAGARIPMQIDIGFGDAVYPEPEFASFPTLLSMEAPRIRAYPREATIAEKFNAMVVLDIRNSRMAVYCLRCPRRVTFRSLDSRFPLESRAPRIGAATFSEVPELQM